MCDTDRESRGMITLRMKSPSSLFNNALHNESNTSSSSPSTALNYHSAPNCQIGSPSVSAMSNATQLAEYHRLQIYDYATQASVRYRLGHPAFAASAGHYGLAAAAAAAAAAYTHPAFGDGTSLAAISPFARFDPRFRFMHEEPKPQHSYIGLIAMAILSNPEQKMVLSDIYQYILDNYPYFRNRGPGWRNSIRHNLSLNDCFVKAGRSANGKGHYWAIHPANIDDFKKGDFRRRKAQRKVRKHMGLAVPDDDDSPSPTPPPVPQSNLTANPSFGPNALLASGNVHIPSQPLCAGNVGFLHDIRFPLTPRKFGQFDNPELRNNIGHLQEKISSVKTIPVLSSLVRSNKRQFDVESLLAPDCDSTVDDSGNFQMGSVNKKSNISTVDCDDEIGQTEDNQRSNSPSINSLNDFIVTKADSVGSNSSSPSISSSVEKLKSPPQPMLPFFQNTAINFPASSWQTAHLKSLQSLQMHQMNAGLINASLLSGGSGNFSSNMPWAMSATAISNAQVAAATLLGYATVANQNFDLPSHGEKH